MQHSHRLARLITVLCLIVALPAAAQKEEASRIAIAIPDLKPLGTASPETIAGVTDLIIHEIANIPIFTVLERKQATELYGEISYQLLTASVMDDAVRNSEIRGARALLLGSFGDLYGKILIAVRLVDLKTGQILFATSLLTEEASLKNSIAEIAGFVEEKGRELSLVVTPREIAEQVSARNWSEAKRLIDIYLRSNAPEDTIHEDYEKIIVGLAEDYYKQAKRFVHQGLFDEARLKIAEAIALKPKGEYYGYRESIAKAEDDWSYRRKLETARREASIRDGADRRPLLRDLAAYSAALTVEGARLGASYGLTIDRDDLSLEATGDDWGLELSWSDSVTPADGTAALNWGWYAGLACRYEAIADTGRSLFIQGYASPLLAESFRVANIALTLGLDAGAMLWYGAVSPDGYLVGVSIGSTAILDLKALRRYGAFVQAKVDWRYWPTAAGLSEPSLRLTAGFVF